MDATRRVPRWLVLVIGMGGILAALLVLHFRKNVKFLSGAVIRQDSDLRKQIPIAGVEITAAGDVAAGDTQSDASGFFRLPLRWGIKPGQPITLVFQHAGYQPLAVKEAAGDKLYVVRMAPVSRETLENPDVVVANVDVRYSTKSTAVGNVGSMVKTFSAVNTGDVPCHGHKPCSPDGKWKAAVGSLSLDAGEGDEFQNVRVSCIAGPCPFARIESPSYSHDGRYLKVSALDWSDTATFLLEAEVDRAMISQVSRVTYPVTFGEALNFTLPAGAEGVYVEAEMNGTLIVFPLGPALILDWADCTARLNGDRTRSFRCALKPGYRFKD